MRSPAGSSRTLLLPGPQPPLSHLGATLLRHVVGAGLRFALHSLGAPMPEVPPVRIVRLRLYLDRARLSEGLAGFGAADALVDALVEPGGSGDLPRSAGSVRGAAAFHRTRLRLPTRRVPEPAEPSGSGDSPRILWERCRSTLSTWQPVLGDALLGELLASLRRRKRRSRGDDLSPSLGPEALRMVQGSKADQSALGAVDPLVAPWSETPRVTESLEGRLDSLPSVEPDPLRGGFRETYRSALNTFRTAYLALAQSAHERGLVEATGDAFFIPFDLAETLADDEPPTWLARAVASNRAEYQSLLDVGGPPESIGTGSSTDVVEDRDEWILGPLWPLS